MIRSSSLRPSRAMCGLAYRDEGRCRLKPSFRPTGTYFSPTWCCLIVVFAFILADTAGSLAFVRYPAGTRPSPGAQPGRVGIHPPSMSGDGDQEDNNGSNNNSNESDEERRMTNVRAVQNMFYSSSSTDGDVDPTDMTSASLPWLDHNTGIYYSLPLWREKLGYTELPGRSLLGFVKDPSYTHMFETIIRSNDGNRYFGQLRLDNNDVGINVNAASPASARNRSIDPLPRPKETDMNTPLYSWKDRINNDDAAVVVGTLMRINDHIRLDDGRLMLLLHAIERFVVVEPKQKLPYPVADVLILPDEEELTSSNNDLGLAVSNAVRHWSEFEYDGSIKFPIERHADENDDRIMSLNDVLSAGEGDALGTLMPFVPYSSHDTKVEEVVSANNAVNRGRSSGGGTKSCLPPTFSELAEQGITREVDSFLLQRATNPGDIPDVDDIERDLWILIDEYVQLRGVTNVFPKHLLSLLPRNIDWPETFTLDELAGAYSGIALAGGGEEGSITGSDAYFNRVADRTDYPIQRRQKRLSYACTALLGGPINSHPLLNRTMRRRLLEIPSTKGRLWAATELFEAYNSQFRRE